MGLVNRHAGKPLILGKVNPNDDLWLASAQQGGGLPSNDTVQNLVSLTDLAALAVGQGKPYHNNVFAHAHAHSQCIVPTASA